MDDTLDESLPYMDDTLPYMDDTLDESLPVVDDTVPVVDNISGSAVSILCILNFKFIIFIIVKAVHYSKSGC